MLFAPLTGGEAVSGFSHPYWAISQLAALVLEQCELYTKERKVWQSGEWMGAWTKMIGIRRFRATEDFFLDVGGSLVAQLHLES